MALYEILDPRAPTYCVPAQVLVAENQVSHATPAYKWAVGLSHQKLEGLCQRKGLVLVKRHGPCKPPRSRGLDLAFTGAAKEKATREELPLKIS